jgi:hypothetical protein
MSNNGKRDQRAISWRTLYAIVLIELSLTIAIFYTFTKAFE